MPDTNLGRRLCNGLASAFDHVTQTQRKSISSVSVLFSVVEFRLFSFVLHLLNVFSRGRSRRKQTIATRGFPCPHFLRRQAAAHTEQRSIFMVLRSFLFSLRPGHADYSHDPRTCGFCHTENGKKCSRKRADVALHFLPLLSPSSCREDHFLFVYSDVDLRVAHEGLPSTSSNGILLRAITYKQSSFGLLLAIFLSCEFLHEFPNEPWKCSLKTSWHCTYM